MAANNTDSLISEIERLLGVEQRAPFELPKILDQAAQQAASLSVSCMLSEEKRDIAEACLDKAIAKSKDPIELDSQLLEHYAKRIDYYASRPSTNKTSHSIRVRLGDAVTSLKDLEEGKHLVVMNQMNNTRSIAMVEGIDGNNGVWIRRIKHTKELLSEEKTRFAEPEYITFGEIKNPQSRVFFHVKEQVLKEERNYWNVWIECKGDDYNRGVERIEKAVGKGSSGSGSGGDGYDCSYHEIKSKEAALAIATKCRKLGFIRTIKIYDDDDTFEKEVRLSNFDALVKAVQKYEPPETDE